MFHINDKEEKTMKKLLATVLALMLVLGCTSAMAAVFPSTL